MDYLGELIEHGPERQSWHRGTRRAGPGYPPTMPLRRKGVHRRRPGRAWLSAIGPLAVLAVVAAVAALTMTGAARPAAGRPAPAPRLQLPGLCVQPGGCAPSLPPDTNPPQLPAAAAVPGADRQPLPTMSDPPDPSRTPVGRAAISSPASAAPTPAPTDPILEAPPPLPPPVPTLTVPPCVRSSKHPKQRSTEDP